MFRTIIDRLLLSLDGRDVDVWVVFERDFEDRVALILDPKAHPCRWFFEMVEYLNVEDDEARAMVRKSRANGDPSAKLAAVAAFEAAAALIRGQLAVIET